MWSHQLTALVHGLLDGHQVARHRLRVPLSTRLSVCLRVFSRGVALGPVCSVPLHEYLTERATRAWPLTASGASKERQPTFYRIIIHNSITNNRKKNCIARRFAIITGPLAKVIHVRAITNMMNMTLWKRQLVNAHYWLSTDWHKKSQTMNKGRFNRA